MTKHIDLKSINALACLKSAVTPDHLLGIGHHSAYFALEGFGDETLDQRYALQISTSYLPNTYPKVGPAAHRKPKPLNALLNESTCLTPPKNFYRLHSVGQELLQKEAEVFNLYLDPNISIVPRQSGRSLQQIFDDYSDVLIDDGASKQSAHASASRQLRTRLLENPKILTDLFQQAAEIGLSGIKMRDMHLGNIMCHEDGRLGLVDISTQNPNKEALDQYAKSNADEILNALKLQLIYAPNATEYPDRDGSIHQFTSTLAQCRSQGLSQATGRHPLLNAMGASAKQYPAAFKSIDDVQAHALTLDKNTSVHDLLGALEAQYQHLSR